MNKRLNIRDGVVMGHPFEIAELVQTYANENLEALVTALFETRGALAPHTDELKALITPSDVDGGVRVAVQPGFAICGSGILRVPNETALTVHQERFVRDQEVWLWDEGEWTGPHATLPSDTTQAYWNLRYVESTDTPVELVPYGSGEVDLRVVPSFDLTIDDAAVGISDGVPLARADAQAFAEPTLTDVRDDHAAALRPDRSMLYDLVDPALVDDIETLFEREGFVDDILALLDEKKLQGETIVTRLKDAVDPFFIRTRYEPAVRERLRDLNALDATVDLQPDPGWETEVEWNLYGVTVESVNSTTFTVQTTYDLTQIEYQNYDLPLYLRYEGTEYAIDQISDASTVVTKEAVSVNQSTDPNGAITNGAGEFHISAEPGIHWFRKNKTAKDFSVDTLVREPIGRLKLEPGFWNVILESTGEQSRATKSIGVEIPSLLKPKAPTSLSLTGEQRTPATSNGENDDPIPANPFNEIDTDSNGDPQINQSDLDRYVDAVRQELRRVQQMEVALTIDVTPPPRTRDEGDRALTLGYEAEVEMLTGDGWKTERTMTIHRPVQELMRELTWVDLMTERYRGSVTAQDDLTNLSHNMNRLDVETDSRRPIKENEIVHVSGDPEPGKNGYWRYEPKMRVDQASNLEDADGNTIRTFPYSADAEGYWVQVDVDKGSFQGQTLSRTITGVKGGADYRVTVRPIGEDGQLGEEIVDNTDELRDKFNARLGFDFHRVINDVFSAYKDLMGSVDPGQFNEYLGNRIEEVRALIERAALYGTPPKVTGPFEVPPKPGIVRFSGRNLGSTHKVYMRYAPPGRTDEEQVVREGRFKIMLGQGDPQIALMNLPTLAELSRKAAPLVTIEVNAGARGSDFFTVRYDREKPTIVGPSVAHFREQTVANILTGTTYGNTTSVWRYDPRFGSDNEPTVFGPAPKTWPSGQSWDAQSGVFSNDWEANADGTLKDSPSTEQVTANETETVERLQFQAKRFIPSRVLDVRIRHLPTERLVPQIAYKEPGRWENIVAKPYYYALRHHNNLMELLIPTSAKRFWVDQTFAVEYVYYAADLQGGGLHKGRGLILRDRGSHSDPPSNPSTGDYYYHEGNDEHYVYDDVDDDGTPQWHAAETIAFDRHTFSVQRTDAESAAEQKTEVRFLSDTADAANEADLNNAPPAIRFHTPAEAGQSEPPFTRLLVNGSDLELQAPLVHTASSSTYIFDEFRYRSADTSKNRGSLPSNTKALTGRRQTSDFGDAMVAATTSVEGASVNRIALFAQYRLETDYTVTVDSVLTHQEGDATALLVSVDTPSGINGQYLVEATNEINAAAGDQLDLTGAITSFEKEWDGNGPYTVLRATSFAPAGSTPLTINEGGSNDYVLNSDDGTITLEYVVPGAIDSHSVAWASGSETLSVSSSTSYSGGSDETTLQVDVTWADLWGGSTSTLRDLRPSGDIGDSQYDGPLYHPEDVFDFRDPSMNVKTLTLKVTVTRSGQSKTKRVNIQVTPDVTS